MLALRPYGMGMLYSNTTAWAVPSSCGARLEFIMIRPDTCEVSETCQEPISPHCLGADFGEVVATKHCSVKKKGFSVKRGEAFSE